MLSDPIGDFLIRIKNAYLAKKSQAEAFYSREKEAIALVLKKAGYIRGFHRLENSLIIDLNKEDEKKVSDLRRISKPGLRIYSSYRHLYKLTKGGLGILIVSTPKGIMDHKNAFREKLGGEVIGSIF